MLKTGNLYKKWVKLSKKHIVNWCYFDENRKQLVATVFFNCYNNGNKPVRDAKPDRKEGNCMKVEVRGKNYKVSENLVMIIEKKFAKLDKYFPEEITAEVLTKRESDHFKTEASIHAKKHIFRAEVITMEPFDAVDRLVDKLSTQMSKFKTKLQKKYKDHADFDFAELPEHHDETEVPEVVKKKQLELVMMTQNEAILAMEQLSHKFYIFLNEETDRVSVVYKRHDGDYGLLETVY